MESFCPTMQSYQNPLPVCQFRNVLGGVVHRMPLEHNVLRVGSIAVSVVRVLSS
jgi:hypothetical protein